MYFFVGPNCEACRHPAGAPFIWSPGASSRAGKFVRVEPSSSSRLHGSSLHVWPDDTLSHEVRRRRPPRTLGSVLERDGNLGTFACTCCSAGSSFARCAAMFAQARGRRARREPAGRCCIGGRALVRNGVRPAAPSPPTPLTFQRWLASLASLSARQPGNHAAADRQMTHRCL